MIVQTAIVRIAATVFTVYGLGFIVAPEPLSLHLTDTIPATDSALIDMRATYGGMSVAVGILLFILGASPERVGSGLLAVTVLMVGMAGGRLYGLAVDGSANRLMYVYLALELLLAGISWWAAATVKKGAD